MKDFVAAALPWVIMGLVVAVLAVNSARRKAAQKETPDKQKKRIE